MLVLLTCFEQCRRCWGGTGWCVSRPEVLNKSPPDLRAKIFAANFGMRVLIVPREVCVMPYRQLASSTYAMSVNAGGLRAPRRGLVQSNPFLRER